jgi:hypothetical protein
MKLSTCAEPMHDTRLSSIVVIAPPLDLYSAKRMSVSPWPTPSYVPRCCDINDGGRDERSHLVASARGVAVGMFDPARVITATTTLYRAGLRSAIAIDGIMRH